MKKCETVATFPFCDTVVDELLVTSLIFHAPSGRWGWLGPLWRTEIRDTPVVWGKHSPRFRVVGMNRRWFWKVKVIFVLWKMVYSVAYSKPVIFEGEVGFGAIRMNFHAKLAVFFWPLKSELLFRSRITDHVHLEFGFCFFKYQVKVVARVLNFKKGTCIIIWFFVNLWQPTSNAPQEISGSNNKKPLGYPSALDSITNS